MPDILEHLTEEHRKAEQMLQQLASSQPGSERERVLGELEQALEKHMEVEEDYLYPIVSEALGASKSKEASDEHNKARSGLVNLRNSVANDQFASALEQVQQDIAHHVEEEEGEIFPGLREKAADQVAQLDVEEAEDDVQEDMDAEATQASGGD